MSLGTPTRARTRARWASRCANTAQTLMLAFCHMMATARTRERAGGLVSRGHHRERTRPGQLLEWVRTRIRAAHPPPTCAAASPS
eukprot:6178454-Pleurochrysis_carterae.AAC.1